jgi:aryl-alcohol dehydrogenase-like predicted oxidoreductase
MLGGNVFGWTIDAARSFVILDAFVDAGFTLIDTADVYSRWVPGNPGGESETILGQWFSRSGKRGRVVLATKVGWETSSGQKGLSRKRIVQAVDESLQRLQTDYIDLYQSHVDDPECPIEETLEAYATLITQGKVRAIGASNFSSERLVASIEVSNRRGYPSYQSLQPLYNLYDRRDYEESLAAICTKYGLAVFPYFSLASGFLTGKYRSDADVARSARAGMLVKYLNERGLRILGALDKVAMECDTRPAVVALAWLLTRPGVIAPIASATSLEQLQDLIQAVDLKLSRPAIETLNTASANHEK